MLERNSHYRAYVASYHRESMTQSYMPLNQHYLYLYLYLTSHLKSSNWGAWWPGSSHWLNESFLGPELELELGLKKELFLPNFILTWQHGGAGEELRRGLSPPSARPQWHWPSSLLPLNCLTPFCLTPPPSPPPPPPPYSSISHLLSSFRNFYEIMAFSVQIR